MHRCALITLATVILAASASAQNLLTNPGFDNVDQLDGWSCSSTHGIATWIPDDRVGAPTSGAMQHFVTATSNNQTVTCTQCVGVTELYTYRLGAWHYWPDDPDVGQAGTVRFYFQYYSDASCSTYTGPGDIVVSGHPSLDTWYWTPTDEATAPIGALSALIGIATWQNDANDWVRTRIDDIDFSATTIFRDGFESGDTSWWEP